VGRPEERNDLEDTGGTGRITLKWILMKWDGGVDWTEYSKELSGCRRGNF